MKAKKKGSLFKKMYKGIILGGEEFIEKMKDKIKAIGKNRGNIYRYLAMYLIRRYTLLSLKAVGELFSMDYSAVSQGVKRFDEKIRSDLKVLNMKKKILRELKKA